MSKYFDIHSHLNLAEFKDDWQEVAQRMQAAEVTTATIGTTATTSQKAVEIAKVLNLPAVVGLHPAYVQELLETGGVDAEWSQVIDLAREESGTIKAIGECGFDVFRTEQSVISDQEKLFIKHCELAAELNVPLMLHLRHETALPLGELSAYKLALRVLQEFPQVRTNAHFFAGTQDELKLFLDRGDTVSFTGVITFAHDYDELIKYCPLDRLQAETDAPYVAPVPHRGGRCEPQYVIEVYKKIAELKKLDLTAVQSQLLQNAKNYYGL